MNERFKRARATVSRLAVFSGDGYGWGGGAVVTIDGMTILLGEGSYSHELAEEIAERWNAANTPANRGTENG
jgi:hypothetical protein